MKGIMFKPWKIKAIADSSPDFEWQTRRLAGLNEINSEPGLWHFVTDAVRDIPPLRIGDCLFEHQDGHQIWVKPRYQIGETVYIKEAYSHYGNIANVGLWVADVKYKLDSEIRHIPFNDHQPPFERWWNTGKPLDYFQTPMFMPAWAARYFKEITGVRVERLQDITEQDAIAEGVTIKAVEVSGFFPADYRHGNFRFGYAALWNRINPKHPWSKNEFVFVYSFKKINHKEE